MTLILIYLLKQVCVSIRGESDEILSKVEASEFEIGRQKQRSRFSFLSDNNPKNEKEYHLKIPFRDIFGSLLI